MHVSPVQRCIACRRKNSTSSPSVLPFLCNSARCIAVNDGRAIPEDYKTAIRYIKDTLKSDVPSQGALVRTGQTPFHRVDAVFLDHRHGSSVTHSYDDRPRQLITYPVHNE